MDTFDARQAAQALTGDMTMQAFNANTREKHARHFQHALRPSQIDALSTIDRLQSLVASEAIPLAYIDVFDNGQLMRLVDMHRKSGKTGLAVIAERFRAGSSIRIRDIDKFDPRLGSFAAEIASAFAAESQINLYLTPPGKDGFAPHFDITDVFILQISGSKDWRIFDDYSNRIDLPLPDTSWDPNRFVPSSTPDPITLSQGDVLYLPRGVMHQAFCTQNESMHLTISLTPLTMIDLITRELHRIAASDLQFRQRIPWSPETESQEEATKTAAQVRQCLSKLSDHLDIISLLQSQRKILDPKKSDPDQSKALTQALTELKTPKNLTTKPRVPHSYGP